MLKKLFILIVIGSSSSILSASLINDMQGCQAVLKFVDMKLADAPKSYAPEDVKLVRKGLKTYDTYIQKEIVTPGLLQFNGGDKAKARTMQDQVDTYKSQLVAGFEKRYPQAGLKTDHAISVNECAKKAVPEGADLEALKKAVETMVKLAQTK